MRTVEIRRVARVAVGVAAVLAQAALAISYVGWSVFVVPPASILVLACVWSAGIVAVIWLAIRDAWLAPIIPVAWVVVITLTFEYGKANLGWGA